MRILFVHEVDWLKKVVFDIHSLAECLSMRGHRVFAIDYENTWQRDNTLDLGSLKAKQFDSISRAIKGSSVSLTHPGFIKIPGLSRLSAALTSYREIRNLIIREKIDAIILYSVPTTGFQTLSIAKKHGVPVLFRSIDVLNQLVPVSALRPVTRLMEKKVYASVDRILSLTPGMTKYVTSLGADEKKVRLLLMPVDIGIFTPEVSSDRVRHKWRIADEDRVILFMGTLFDFSGLDVFIPRFAEIAEKIPGAKLLIVGDGPQRPELDGLISRLGMNDRVIITGFEPYETMPEYINLASVCINTFAITKATRDIFPGKTVQFLACGKPLVATRLPGMVAVIPGEEQGVIYSDSPQDVAADVIDLLGSAEKLQKMGEAGLRYTRRVHSYESITTQLEGFIKEVAG